MFVPGIRGGKVWEGPDEAITQIQTTLCHCQCHAKQKPPPAVEARLCRECAEERFQDWQGFVDVLMKGE